MPSNLALWLWKFLSLGILENLDVSTLRQDSYSDSGINSHGIISTKIDVGTVREYSIFIQKYEAILNVLLLLWMNSLSLGIL